ncbi:MAG: zinc ribbon domain-containing protein [Chloroflexi bacterium]|nr:zinc ribbon domain-containing protein [Chloroflexota bacterium]
MTEPLGPDKVERLLVYLRHEAEIIKKNRSLTRDDIKLLLLTSDLEEDWAIDELERWAKILVAARGATDPTKRELVQRALMLRNVPEAPALLAVSLVSDSREQEEISRPHQVSANVAELNLGTYKPGESASGEFQVRGGPGKILVESDQVHVTPSQFGAKETNVRVELKLLNEGVIWTKVALMAGSEILEIPVIAECHTPPSMVESASLGEPDKTPRPPVQTEMKKTKACPQCGHANDNREIYCQHCAYQLTGNQLCPYCHRNIPSDSVFCSECGHKL